MHMSGNLPPIIVILVDEATLVWDPQSKKWISAMDEARRTMIHRWQLTIRRASDAETHFLQGQGHLVAKRNPAQRATNGIWQSSWKIQHGDSYFDKHPLGAEACMPCLWKLHTPFTGARYATQRADLETKGRARKNQRLGIGHAFTIKSQVAILIRHPPFTVYSQGRALI